MLPFVVPPSHRPPSIASVAIPSPPLGSRATGRQTRLPLAGQPPQGGHEAHPGRHRGNVVAQSIAVASFSSPPSSVTGSESAPSAGGGSSMNSAGSQPVGRMSWLDKYIVMAFQPRAAAVRSPLSNPRVRGPRRVRPAAGPAATRARLGSSTEAITAVCTRSCPRRSPVSRSRLMSTTTTTFGTDLHHSSAPHGITAVHRTRSTPPCSPSCRAGRHP
jgi:hypothetical protein